MSKFNAIYCKSEIPDYDGNPLIEALPPILTNDEATAELSYYPKFHEELRNAPDHIRYHAIQNGLRFFSALDINLDLERRFSCLIRVGYSDRNPTNPRTWKKMEQRLSKLGTKSRSQYGVVEDYESTAALGFNIIGISGIGKSQTVERILKLYPQTIIHSRYKMKNFTHVQLVWMKLDCPFDGSIKGLCFNFFISIDDLLGTTYFEKYAKHARNVDEMIPKMARVAKNHFIGVLVIDEIQRLSKSKSGGAEKMLDFFVQMVNTIGVPMVLVGTYKALSFLSGALSQMRRGSGQGDLVWDRMQLDEQWQLFAEDLWEFQYLKNPYSLQDTPKLGQVLYDESQGITDLAVKLFMFSQELAITSGQEMLTSSIIRSAAKAKLTMLQPVLKALRNKDKRALSHFEDAYPTYLEHLLKTQSSTPQILGAVTNEPELRIVMHEKDESKETGANLDSGQETKEAVEEFFSEKTTKDRKTRIKPEKPAPPKGGLLDTFQSVKNPNNDSVYEALKEKGFVKSGDESILGFNSDEVTKK